MVDKISKKARSINMGHIRSKDTAPEMIVRKLLYRSGYRYRLHRKDLPGKPDIVFIGRKKAIFVHGCFWHQHDSAQCKISRLPKSRTDYWIPKLENNVKRDRRHQEQLVQHGWKYLVAWECETADLQDLTNRIHSFLSD